jgi:pimeloyl-ACP methyl ester carboxylesterase
MKKFARRFLLPFALAFVATLLAFYVRPLAVFGVIRSVLLRLQGFHSRYVQTGAWSIHYVEGGDGPPLVIIHGLSSRGEDFSPLLPSLARAHHVYAIDLLGFGRSDRPDVDYSVALQATVLRQFLDAVKVGKSDLVGVSMGGWTALKLAAEHPERVRRLVLIDSAGFRFMTTLDETSFSPTTSAQLHTLLELQAAKPIRMPGFIARDFLRRAKENSWITRRMMRSMLSAADAMDGKVARVTMPLLIVWGTADRLTPYPLAIRMKREMPQAEIVPLDGCGHIAILECRDRVLPQVESFLAVR